MFSLWGLSMCFVLMLYISVSPILFFYFFSGSCRDCSGSHNSRLPGKVS